MCTLNIWYAHKKNSLMGKQLEPEEEEMKVTKAVRVRIEKKNSEEWLGIYKGIEQERLMHAE